MTLVVEKIPLSKINMTISHSHSFLAFNDNDNGNGNGNGNAKTIFFDSIPFKDSRQTIKERCGVLLANLPESWGTVLLMKPKRQR